jgi:hypothetical protein
VLQSSPNSHQQHPTTLISPYQHHPSSTPTKNHASSFATFDNGPVVPLPMPMPPSSGRVTPYNNNNNIPALAPRVDTRTSPTFSYDRSKSNSSARVQASSSCTPSPPSKYSRPLTSAHINDHRPDVVVESSTSYSFGRTSSSTSQESTTRCSNQQKSKLPHGLTVQELKEMTKARLQAEASTVDLRVDESSTRGRNLQTPEPFGSGLPASAQASPLQPGFPANSSPRDAWSQDSRGGGTNEAWDNASVSTCASDAYLGSEYPPSMNGNQNFDDYIATPFVRSRSHPVASSSSGNCASDVPSQVHASSSNNHLYYDGYGGAANRRRAQTMSPRIGLSYVHEDRPVLGDDHAAAHHHIISFPQQQAHHSHHHQQQQQPCRQQRMSLPAPSQSAFTPSPFRYGGHNNGGGVPTNNANSGIYGGGGGGECNNRQRAFSTTSLPATSTTADEFGIASSSHRFASQFVAVREDVPLCAPSTGLADVFRGSGLSSTASPTGLMCGTQGLGITTTSSSGGGGGGGHLYPGNIGDSRNRAATWSDPTSSDMFSGLMCNEQLSDDLASILKLSGASEDKSPSGWDQLFAHRPPGM